MDQQIDLKKGELLRKTIATEFWKKLSRELTIQNADDAAYDSKQRNHGKPAIFLPNSGEEQQFDYYSQDANLEIEKLPKVSEFNDDFYYRVGQVPGILALSFNPEGKPMHYVVPGGRFNEFYGWDSYFVGLGLIQDGFLDLASNIVSQFSFEIRNYGKILNANRPYFLGRSQPPFVTDLAWRLHDHATKDLFVDWIKAAILEYKTVWTAEPRYDRSTGLSKYVAQGRGIPPEVEAGHYDEFLKPFAKKHQLDLETFVTEYNAERLSEPELDTYLLHDRSLRESGHDVASRFVGCCADLVTIDLASLLYKYELDIAKAIELYPGDFPEESAAAWYSKASERKKAVNKYLWDPERGYYGDFNVKTKSLNTNSESTYATILWPLWCGLASEEQAQSIVLRGLPHLEFSGGISSSSKIADANRQWDYPAGWAPHQLLAWEGLDKYGFKDVVERLCSKWIATVLRGAEQTEGALFEKYDVTGVENPQDVRAEYGNQGSSETGFGWTNSSFVIGWDRYIKK